MVVGDGRKLLFVTGFADLSCALVVIAHHVCVLIEVRKEVCCAPRRASIEGCFSSRQQRVGGRLCTASDVGGSAADCRPLGGSVILDGRIPCLPRAADLEGSGGLGVTVCGSLSPPPFCLFVRAATEREDSAVVHRVKCDRQGAEAELDANEHHIADMQTAIERLTDELEQACRELRQAQSRTRKLERALTRAAVSPRQRGGAGMHKYNASAHSTSEANSTGPRAHHALCRWPRARLPRGPRASTPCGRRLHLPVAPGRRPAAPH